MKIPGWPVGVVDERLSFDGVHEFEDEFPCDGCVVGNTKLEDLHDWICQRSDFVDEVYWNHMTDA